MCKSRQISSVDEKTLAERLSLAKLTRAAAGCYCNRRYVIPLNTQKDAFARIAPKKSLFNSARLSVSATSLRLFPFLNAHFQS